MISHVERKAELLSKFFIGPDLDREELLDLAGLVHMKQAQAGEFIFGRGDSGHTLMIVISGKVLIFSTSSGGKQLIINIIGPGGGLR